jgi:hypothetical protein
MDSELLAMFKKSIGDLSAGTELDDFYGTFLTMANTQLAAEDISETVLSSELGKFAIVFCAELLMYKKSIADNGTMILLKNLLSAKTKAERYPE